MELLLCVISVCGILTVLWCLTALLFFPVADDSMALVWRIEGPCPELEFRVRGYLWLRQAGFFRARLLLADCGLDPEARRCAEVFAQEHACVILTDRATTCPDGTETHERDRTRDPARRRADGDLSKSR